VSKPLDIHIILIYHTESWLGRYDQFCLSGWEPVVRRRGCPL